MTETNLSIFSGLCSTWMQNIILIPLRDHILKEKGVSITLEEMIEVLHMPSRQLQQPVIAGSMPLFNSTPQYNTVRPQLLSSNSSVAVPREPGEVLRERLCNYKFKRGKSKGEYCPKTVNEGGIYCSACSKRVSTTSAVATRDDSVLSASNTHTEYEVPGLIGIEQKNTGEINLKCVPVDREHGIFKTVNHEFIIKKESATESFAMGRVCGDRVLPLTDADKELAISIGLLIPVNKTNSAIQETTPTPTPNQVVPITPTVNVPSLGMSVPSIPDISNMSNLMNNKMVNSPGLPNILNLPVLSMR